MDGFGTCFACGSPDVEIDEDGRCKDCSAESAGERGPDMGIDEEEA